MAEIGDDFNLEDDLPLDQLEEGEEGGEERQQEETPAPVQQGMSVEQMQQLLDQQQANFEKQQAQQNALLAQALSPRQEAQLIEEPDPAAMLKAVQEGDAETFLKLQQQKDAARDQRNALQLQRLEQAGAQRFNEVNAALLTSAVPDYEAHKEAVNKQMDELGLQGDLRVNPKIVEILTRSEAGRPENIEKEIEARIQARRRQANSDAQPGEVSNTTRRQTQRPQEQPQVFRPEALYAFSYTGKDPDDFARKMGFDDWDAYQANAAELMGQETVTTHKFLQGREHEFRR